MAPPSAPMAAEEVTTRSAASNGDAAHPPLPTNRSVGLVVEAGVSDIARTRSFAKLRSAVSHGDLAGCVILKVPPPPPSRSPYLFRGLAAAGKRGGLHLCQYSIQSSLR